MSATPVRLLLVLCLLAACVQGALASSCAVPDAVLPAPTTSCQLRPDEASETRHYRVDLLQGQTYTFTLCDSSCAGSEAAFDSQLELLDPFFQLVAVNGDACGDDGEIVYTTDALTGGGSYCLRVRRQDAGDPAFELGWRVACQPPDDLGISPLSAGTQDQACGIDEGFVATASGTGPFDWSWDIFPQPPNTATPASFQETTNSGSSRFDTRLEGLGDYTVTVTVSNECGSLSEQIVYGLSDARGPDIVCGAESCEPESQSLAASGRPALRATANALVPTVPQAPAQTGPVPEQQRLATVRKLDRLHSTRRSLSEPAGLLREPVAEGLSCTSPCAGGTLGASNPYYEVFLDCSDGSFTARTGDAHSVTLAASQKQNVIFGGQSAAPGTSDISFYVHDSNSHYRDPFGGQACMFDPPDTAEEPASVGIEAEWTRSPLPGVELVLREEIVAFGDSEESSGIRMTLAATNLASSSAAVDLGVRWQIDYQNGGDDGPLYAPVSCDPFEVGDQLATEHEFTPAEIEDFYRIQNNTGRPIFGNFTNTTAIAGFASSGEPDRLIYGYWPSLVGSGWNYIANEGDLADGDSAVLYYFGYTPATATRLQPGESFRRSVVIFTSGDAQDCGGFTPGTGADAELTLCQDECAELGAEASDNCDPAPAVALVETSPGAPPCVGNPCQVPFPVAGSYDYVWEAVDASGNTTSCTSTVEVLPLDDPRCNQPPACDAGGPYLSDCRQAAIDAASAGDPDEDALTTNWTSDNPDVRVDPPSAVLPPGPSPQPLPPATASLDPSVPACGVDALLTLEVDDGRGGSSSCETQVSFDDTLAPLLPALVDGVAECDAVPEAPELEALDNCDEDVPVSFQETITPGACPDAYTITRSYQASDDCGNSANSGYVIEVDDTTAPELSGVPADIAAECDAVPPPAMVTASDNCAADAPVEFDQTRTPGACPDSYTLERSWSASDACGNTTSASQTISVNDSTPPVLSGVPADISVACDAVPPPAQVTASDNCAQAVPVEYQETRTPGPCPHSYTLTRSWTASDACGNTTSASQTINVSDSSPPALAGVPADTSVECDAVPPPALVTASDNCDPDPQLVYDEQRVDGDCEGDYTLTRSWTASDACGNTTSASQTLEVRDTTPPVVSVDDPAEECLWPPNHWYVCLDSSQFVIDASDNCSAVAVELSGCSSDQPDDAREDDPASPWNGDGHTSDDCLLVAGRVCARAERAGTGPDAQAGRHYGVLAVASDSCGNSSDPVEAASIHVPHDQSPAARECLDPTRVGCRPNQQPPCEE